MEPHQALIVRSFLEDYWEQFTAHMQVNGHLDSETDPEDVANQICRNLEEIQNR